LGKPREEDKALRAEVLKRDKRTCQMCLKKKRKLQIHHIQRWADAIYLRFDPDNCITLCSSCHFSIRNQETYYMQYFFEIVCKNKKNQKK
jgi:5-methylcytosine-specific restriction endonuclease McrA